MRAKKPLKHASGGMFFIHTFFQFARRWEDRAELTQMGITFDPPNDQISMTQQASDLVHALIMAGTRPKHMIDDVEWVRPKRIVAMVNGVPKLTDYAGTDEQWQRETETTLNTYRRDFFIAYCRAPEFTLAVLAHLRRSVNPIRLFFQGGTDKFFDGRKYIDLNTATDGEIAAAIEREYGERFSVDAVTKERQRLTGFMMGMLEPRTPSQSRRDILAYLRPKRTDTT